MLFVSLDCTRTRACSTEVSRQQLQPARVCIAAAGAAGVAVGWLLRPPAKLEGPHHASDIQTP
jgi:hypothetical protein